MIGVVDNGCIKVEFEASVPEKQKGRGVFMGKTFSSQKNDRSHTLPAPTFFWATLAGQVCAQANGGPFVDPK